MTGRRMFQIACKDIEERMLALYGVSVQTAFALETLTTEFVMGLLFRLSL